MKKSLGYQNMKQCIPLCILTFSVLPLTYNLLNKWNGPANNLVTDLDRAIPFLKIFVVPYTLWYPFFVVAVILLIFKDKDVFFNTVVSINIAEGICFLIYFFFQTTVPRPVLEGNDVFTSLIRMIYHMDEPFNCFPSIHVLTTFLLLKGINKLTLNGWTKAFFHVAGLLIIISTVFIKQHVVIDLFSAIILSEGISRIVSMLRQKEPLTKQSLPYPFFKQDKNVRKYI